ncbi:hypothetical protein FDA77_00975 [Clostridium botulinum]|nr:hypothetical protein [Clostridium botulinum]NFJ88522.1 hypothetical protein [Clostridium botulinum]HDI3121662.1 hypothetical protein [Clostridium botulinum]
MKKDKELTIRLTLMNSKEWVQTINTLKTLQIDNENKDYTVVYKKENQRKNREFTFHKVEYVEETKGFIFTSFELSDEDSLTDEMDSRETLMDIEIVKIRIEDKEDSSMGCFI